MDATGLSFLYWISVVRNATKHSLVHDHRGIHPHHTHDTMLCVQHLQSIHTDSLRIHHRSLGRTHCFDVSRLHCCSPGYDSKLPGNDLSTHTHSMPWIRGYCGAS